MPGFIARARRKMQILKSDSRIGHTKMLFSNEALEFLYINRLNDSREWYNEHKPEYRRLIIERNIYR